jgi:HlyD family secretion protein
MKKYVIGGGALILITLAGFFIFFKGDSEKGTKQSGQVQRLVNVTRGDLNLSVAADGIVQPINKVELRSKAGGKIVQLNFIDGQYVKQGDLLLLVDQTITKNNLDQARADLETAQASLLQSQNTDKRTQELYSKGLVSQQDVDQSNTDLVRAQAQLVKAKAALSNAEDQMNDTRIVAPASGIVLSKNVELGQLISSATSNVGGGTLLATVADMNNVYVYAKVDEVDIGKVKPGQKASVIADAYPDDTFEGRVERIAPQGTTSQNVTTFDVIILVRNEGQKLKSGMSTSVDIQIFNKKNVMLLPNEAVVDPKSEQGKTLVEEWSLASPQQGVGTTDARILTDADQKSGRNQMHERLAKMSPAEREKARSEWRKKRVENGGISFSENSGGQTLKPRRQAQVNNENEIRWKIAFVKENENYKPRFVKTAASNFDYTEIVEGLKEGDEIQINIVSRAKIASEQMTTRIKNSSPLSGGTGGGGGRLH